MKLSYETQIPRTPLHERIMAKLRVQASWLDKNTGESVSVEGTTENVGVLDDETTLFESPVEVIRVERDPTKPLAALAILRNLTKWNDVVLLAARSWVAEQWKLNYEEEYAN
jgi:hypothetical protein